jgi:hypothetical protein
VAGLVGRKKLYQNRVLESILANNNINFSSLTD